MTVNGQRHDVVAIGNAIVDVLVQCDDELIRRLGLEKGAMSLVDAARAKEIYGQIGTGVEASGGSAANTAAAVASLGGDAAFLGKVRDDEFGEIFAHDLTANGVHYATTPAAAGARTAHCLVLITPDAQRTMCTHLGIAGQLSAEDVDRELVKSSAITFLEGYLVGLPTAEAAISAAIAAARQSDRRVALTLSDPTWVTVQHDAFVALLPDVDILLANEHEACHLTGETEAAAAVKALTRSCPVVAVTRSEHGALVSDGSNTVAVPAETANQVIDTTGAGDGFAAGFLLGLARQHDIAVSARLGALAAAEVIGHLGARPEISLAGHVRQAGITLQPPEPCA
jgi:sugar/nucleoside kinase (ribokinase family)